MIFPHNKSHITGIKLKTNTRKAAFGKVKGHHPPLKCDKVIAPPGSHIRGGLLWLDQFIHTLENILVDFASVNIDYRRSKMPLK